MQMPTPNTFKTLRTLAADVMDKRSKAAALRTQIDAIKRGILGAGNFVSEYDGTRITEPSRDWMMEDDQAEGYYALLDDAKIAAGFDPEPIREGFCPALVAESAVRDAEHDLIEAGRQIPGCEHVTSHQLLCTKSQHGGGLETHAAWIDLLINLAGCKA